MSDSAEAGSVAAEAQPAGNPAEAQPPPDNGSAGAAAPQTWLDGLSEGNRRLAESKGWKEPGDIDKVFTSYAELEQQQGSSVRVPAEDASQEEWDDYLSHLPPSMRPPESADKYEFKLPDGLPEDLPYDEGLAEQFKAWALEGKASNTTAEFFHNKFVEYMAEQHKAQAAETAERVETVFDDLVKEWGPKDSDGFQQKHQLADRAIKKLGLVDAFKESGILLPDGALTNAQVAKALVAVGESMFREDTIESGGGLGANTGPNPFVKDAKGNRNLTAISKLIKSDPDRAKRLAQEAGERWGDWASSNPR